MSIHTVLLAGATGDLGKHILPALLDAGFAVTALSRASSASSKSLPAGVKVARVPDDYPVDALVPAVRGHDAVVCALGGPAYMGPAQAHLLAAAAQAGGVQLFMPSEFGSGLDDGPWLERIPVFQSKKAFREGIPKTGLAWSAVSNGAFFEWGLDVGFLKIDVKQRKATVLGDGEARIAMSRMGLIADAVVGVLRHPDQVKNRMAYVQSFAVSQMDIVRALEKEMGVQFAVERLDPATFVEENERLMAQGNVGAMYEMVFAGATAEGEFKHLANDAIGVPQQDFHAAIKEYVKSKAA